MTQTPKKYPSSRTSRVPRTTQTVARTTHAVRTTQTVARTSRVPRTTQTAPRAAQTPRTRATPRARAASDDPVYVACLWPEFFAPVLHGTKRFEYRFRQGDDPVLDRLRAALDDPQAPAPWLLIFESRTRRCLLTSIHAVRITSRFKQRCYRLTLGRPCELPAQWPMSWRPQGVRCVPWEVWMDRLPRTLIAGIRAAQTGYDFAPLVVAVAQRPSAVLR